MSVWKKAMFYLGLGPEDTYESTPPPEGMPEVGMAPPIEHGGGHVAPILGSSPDVTEPSAVRALGPMDVKVDHESNPITAVKSVPSSAPLSSAASASASVRGINTVRPLPASSGSASKPHIVSPRSFNDAQEVADRFRAGAPVIMNLQEVARDLSRRLIDFASGMCYGLSGQMEKVGDRVYLLSPADVELSPEDRRELHEQGLHNG